MSSFFIHFHKKVLNFRHVITLLLYLCILYFKGITKFRMVQTKQANKQDHCVIRQLLSAGARVPPIAVFKSLPKKTDVCSATKMNDIDNINESITIELIEVDDKSITDFNDIDLSSSSELFPEIGLPLPDLNDIDDMVTNETSPSPDYSKSVLNSVQAPTTPECVESMMSCSFPRSDDALYTLFGRADNVTSPCIVTSPAQSSELQDRGSPMQIYSSSDSEAGSAQPTQSTVSSPMQYGSSTIKSLLNRPPMNASVSKSHAQTTCTKVTSLDSSPSAPMIPTVVQAAAVIPLSVLAMGDDETAVEAQKKLKEIDGQHVATSSAVESSEEEQEIEEESVRPVRRRWVKKTSSVSSPRPKRVRKASSVSSEQDFDLDMDDDVDSEVSIRIFCPCCHTCTVDFKEYTER